MAAMISEGFGGCEAGIGWLQGGSKTLKGAIPNVASMWNIKFFDVSHNLLTGTIPHGVGAQPDFR
eukprot:1481554-Amphidinium_carterae.1